MNQQSNTKNALSLAILALGLLGMSVRAMEEGSSSSNQVQSIEQTQEETVTLRTNDGVNIRVPKSRAILCGTIRDLLEDSPAGSEIPLHNVSSTVLLGLLSDLGCLEEPLRCHIERWNAAEYLQIPKLMKSYAKDVADMIVSDESLRLLHENNERYIATLNRIKPGLKHLVCKCIPTVYAWLETEIPNGGMLSEENMIGRLNSEHDSFFDQVLLVHVWQWSANRNERLRRMVIEPNTWMCTVWNTYEDDYKNDLQHKVHHKVVLG